MSKPTTVRLQDTTIKKSRKVQQNTASSWEKQEKQGNWTEMESQQQRWNEETEGKKLSWFWEKLGGTLNPQDLMET